MKKLSALEAIRKFCLQCQGGVSANVTECQYTACPFYAYRMGVALPAGKHRPLKTIRTYCVEECQAGNQGQVDDCQGDTAAAGSCPVFLFRMGRNPNITKEHRENCAQQLSAAWRMAAWDWHLSCPVLMGPFSPQNRRKAPGPMLVKVWLKMNVHFVKNRIFLGVTACA